MLNEKELTELKYLYELGFKYIVRNEIGSVEVFKNKPKRNKGTGYATWVENKYPMTQEEMDNRKDVKLGEYDFITWEYEPILIEDLICNYKYIKYFKKVDFKDIKNNNKVRVSHAILEKYKFTRGIYTDEPLLKKNYKAMIDGEYIYFNYIIAILAWKLRPEELIDIINNGKWYVEGGITAK